MRAGKRFVLFGLSLVVAFATHVGTARAVATVSDRVVITDAAGNIVVDLSVPEPAAGEDERSISFGNPVDPFSLLNSITVLTEPLGAPPGENPIFLPGTTIIISDLFLSNPNQDGALFLSDGDPLLALVVAAGVLSKPTGIKFLEETGDLQLIGTSAVTGFSTFLQSDVEVVPEPGTLLLFGTGLVGLAAGARRGRRLRA